MSILVKCDNHISGHTCLFGIPSIVLGLHVHHTPYIYFNTVILDTILNN